MKETTLAGEQTVGVSRRVVLKTATTAAVGLALGTSTRAHAAAHPIYYGTGSGQTPLDATNIFPLLAAWLLLTTNGPPETVDKATISSVANLDNRSTDAILALYKDAKYSSSFGDVRKAFSDLAKKFASVAPYSGGQCPEKANTIAPIAALPCSQKHA